MKADYQVGIIGAGFGGLGAAIQLHRAGNGSFVVFERAAEVGGTWRDNSYPGCACDVPSHLYSFSFEPNSDWSRSYSGQSEILEYLKTCVVRNGIKEKIRFNSEVKSAQFDEKNVVWKLTDQNGYSCTVKYLISATGPLNRPNRPKFKGLESFKGKVFHSAEWDHTYDLNGKKVAVIGTGASAIQIVPSIAPIVSDMHVFQRSAAWVMPRHDRYFTGLEKGLFKAIPGFRRMYREFYYWVNEFFGLQFVGSKFLNKAATVLGKKHIQRVVKDPETARKLTPDYTIGCKRILVSDDYFPAFNRPNVHLVTDPISEITENGLLTASGKSIAADALIFSTGFIAAEVDEVALEYRFIGLNNRNLLQEWKETGPEAYKGISVSGFPNLFLLLGPNTGLGHNSVVHMMESQLNYIFDYIGHAETLKEGKFYDVKPKVQQAYNERIQAELKHTVWASGCKSWYVDSAGRNTTLWPKLTVSYRQETRIMDVENYDIKENH